MSDDKRYRFVRGYAWDEAWYLIPVSKTQAWATWMAEQNTRFGAMPIPEWARRVLGYELRQWTFTQPVLET